MILGTVEEETWVKCDPGDMLYLDLLSALLGSRFNRVSPAIDDPDHYTTAQRNTSQPALSAVIHGLYVAVVSCH